MEFIEKVNLRSAHYLIQQLSSNFYADHGDADTLKLSCAKKVLYEFIKTGGCRKVSYKRSVYDTHNQLRQYSIGLQSMPKAFRGLLCNGIYSDIDMVNCHPTLLLNICHKHNILCPYLKQYCMERDELITKGWTTKLEVNKILNSEWKIKDALPWVSCFDFEIKQIHSALIHLYPVLYELAKQKNPKNANGTLCSYICQEVENKILELIVKTCPYPIGVLMFDGLMVEGEVTDSYLEELKQLVQHNLNFDVTFIVKPHDTSIVIPDDFVYEDEDELYAQEKEKQEKNGLAYIETTSEFSIRLSTGNIIFKSKSDMQIHFENNLIGKTHFFAKWLQDPTRATYTNVGVYCHDVECPKGVLNLWSGFHAERHPTELVDIEKFHTHCKIMSNHNDEFYKFLIKWFANMLQYPSSPSVYVCISSEEEGTGKSLLVELIKYIVGGDKFSEINDPSTQLFGTFNGHLQNTVLCNLNEIDRKDMSSFHNKLKTLINSPTVSIHHKGKKPFDITNTQHFFATTNNLYSTPSKDGNRRFASTECSAELKGNNAYFDDWAEWIKRRDVQYSVYHYLMHLPTPVRFTAKDIPQTQNLKDVNELNRDPIEDFMTAFSSHINAEQLYQEYKHYLKDHGYDFVPTAKSFQMKFARLKDKYKIIIKENVMYNGEHFRKLYIRPSLLT